MLVPLGGVSTAQLNPPSDVEMIVEPAPGLPELPTATHPVVEKHEMPVRSTADSDGDAELQLDPLSDVFTASGVESKFVPAARQLPSKQLIAFNCFPLTEFGAAQVLPPFAVLMVVLPVVELSPTATQ